MSMRTLGLLILVISVAASLSTMLAGKDHSKNSFNAKTRDFEAGYFAESFSKITSKDKLQAIAALKALVHNGANNLAKVDAHTSTSNSLSFEDFAAKFMSKIKILRIPEDAMKDKMNAIFKYYDINKDNKITSDELRALYSDFITVGLEVLKP